MIFNCIALLFIKSFAWVCKNTTPKTELVRKRTLFVAACIFYSYKFFSALKELIVLMKTLTPYMTT